MNKRKKIEKLLRDSAEMTPSPTHKQELLERAKTIAPEPVTVTVRSTPKKRLFPRRLVTAAIALCLLLTLTVGSFGVYGENYQSVYLDINPSIELVINRFNTVNKVICHNDDAKAICKKLPLKGKSLEDGITLVLDALYEGEYLKDGAELYITTSAKKKDKSEKLLEKLTEKLEKHADKKGYQAKVITKALSKDEIAATKDKGISPAKYQLITAILESSPDYTEESLAKKSMKELRELLESLSDQ